MLLCATAAFLFLFSSSSCVVSAADMFVCVSLVDTSVSISIGRFGSLPSLASLLFDELDNFPIEIVVLIFLLHGRGLFAS